MNRGAHLHILLAENNDGDRVLVRNALEGAEATLDIVSTGEEVMSYLRRSPPYECAPQPDLILLDLKMPRMTGLELLANVRGESAFCHIPCIVLTSSQAPQDVQQAYQLGARACFAKPVGGPDELLKIIVQFYEQVLRAPMPDVSAPAAAAQKVVAPQELQRSQLLAALVDSAADAIISTDLHGTILTWNPAAALLYGYRREEAVGRSVRLVIPADREAEFNQILEAVQRGEGPQYLRTVRVTRDDREIHVELMISPMHDSAGRLIGKSVVARDATSHTQAEERFRLAVEASPSAMLMVDSRGRIVLINAELERLFGYSRAELVGRPVETLVPARLRERHPEHRAGFLEAPAVRRMGAGRELFGVRKDGREIPVEIALNPIETSDGPFVLSSVVDITERLQGEHRFRLAVDASPNGIVMVDGNGAIILTNAEVDKMFGYVRGELVGRAVDDLVPSRFRGQHAQHRIGFMRSPSARSMGSGRDLYGLRKDGTEFPVEVGINPIDTPQGTIVLSTVLDITERKHAEAALSVKAEELRRSNEELEQFAYVASHDLREPLRMVSSFTKLLSKHLGPALDAKSSEYIAFAQDGADRMSQLIDDLLSYSRVRTSGKQLVPLEAASCLRLAERNLSVAIAEAEAWIESTVAARVMADSIQLTAVFQNLLANAIKFRRGPRPHIEVTARPDGARYVFAVRDDGIGIPPQYAERVFQMFDRLHERESFPGTGIGLALCRRVIQRHGGTIWIESDGHDGTTVLFTLQASETQGIR